MKKQTLQGGFTIVELMIATSVFSLILLIISYGLISMGKTYNKGITQSRTQDVARQIIDKIAQDIQFAGPPIIPITTQPTAYAICIGSDRFSVNPGVKLDDAVGNHSLMLDTPINDTPADNCNAANPIHNPANVAFGNPLPTGNPNNPVELLSPSMRIVDLSVTQLPSDLHLYQLHIRLLYGDDDLLQDTNADGKVDSCLVVTGSQFCAVSDITTIVDTRSTP